MIIIFYVVVEIVATLKRKGQEDALILLNIYRPPIGTYILELPAGMVDAGETIEAAGLRELKEETGYTGKIVASPPVVVRFSQAISNTSSRIVFVEVDGDLPENQKPETSLEEDELCRTVILPVSKAYDRLLELSEKTGSVDGKLFMLIAGFLNVQQFKSN